MTDALLEGRRFGSKQLRAVNVGEARECFA